MKSESLDLLDDSADMFPKGYGEFPYIIWKIGYAFFKQIPIHFVTTESQELPGGTLLIEDTYSFDLKELISMHQTGLIGMVKTVKKNMEKDKGAQQKLCLVCSPNKAFYFDKDSIEESESIPSGGNLVSIDNKLIAMATKHYKEN